MLVVVNEYYICYALMSFGVMFTVRMGVSCDQLLVERYRTVPICYRLRFYWLLFVVWRKGGRGW